MAPSAVRMVLVEGENGDGATVDEDNFRVADEAPVNAAGQVVSAILGTREGAAEGGYHLASTGVTWTDPIEAAALRDALAAHKIENVMLVSAFLAAAALAHAVGNETNYLHTALLFIEPATATLAVVDTADGSIADIQRHELPDDDDAAVAQLATLVSSAEELQSRPDGVFVVGSGIDIPLIKPALEAATTLPVSAPEEPDTALARGAALASANAPLFSSSTAARAYALDPGTGVVNPFVADAAYFDVPAVAGAGEPALAYSAVSDDPSTGAYAPYTGEHASLSGLVDAPRHRSFAMVGSAVAAIFVIGVTALVVALAISIRPTSSNRPDPGRNVVEAPTQQAPEAPAPAPQAPAPEPQAPAPVPQAPAPQAPAPVPQAPAQVPVPQAPAPAPAPVPQAPAPAPAPVAPVPVPVPVPVPPIFNPPGPGGGGPGLQGPRGGGPDGPRGGPGRGGGGPRGGGPKGGFGGGGPKGGFGIPGIPGI